MRASKRELLRRVNVEGTVRAAALAADQGVRRFVYLSSVKANEPQDAYGHAKLAAEQALRRTAAASTMQPVILRPPLVYGPRVKANFLALMRAVARGWPLPFASIENRRSLIYVGNLCDAILACLQSAKAPGEPISSATGRRVDARSFAARSAMRSAGRLACSVFRAAPASEQAQGLARGGRCAAAAMSSAGSRRFPSRKD